VLIAATRDVTSNRVCTLAAGIAGAARQLRADGMAASLCTAFLLWLVGGYLGWHYVYLGRDRESVIFAQTGGLMGMGWLLDVFKLPRYVREANGEPAYAGDVDKKGAPAFAVWRLSQGWLLAYAYGTVAQLYFAWEADDVRFESDFALRQADFAAVACAATLGAAFVGGVGGQRTRKLPVLAVTFAALQALERNPESEWKSVQVAALAAAAAAAYFRTLRPGVAAAAAKAAGGGAAAAGGAGREARVIKDGVLAAAAPPTPAALAARAAAKRGCCGSLCRLLKLGAAVGAFWLLGGTGLLLQSDMHVDEHGSAAKEGLQAVKVGVYLFRNREKIAAAAVELYGELRRYASQRGFAGLREDVLGQLWEENEYDTLGVARDASLADVKAAHRKLVRELHPDRLPASLSEAERTAAVNKFRKVQQAYEALSKKLGRTKGNRDGGGGGGGDEEAGGSGARARGGRARRGGRGGRGGGDDDL
jgi:hypothetical protein